MIDPGERARRTVRALGLLMAASIRRLMREGMVLRSMVWPSAVVLGTLTSTIAVLAIYRPTRDVAVAPDLDPALIEAFQAADFDVHPTDDLRGAVEGGWVPFATDGRRLWVRASSTTPLEVEQVLRIHLDSPWYPAPPMDRPNLEAAQRMGRIISAILGMLFVMYGAVFGLGSVARDRDDGTLEAELALPVPRWVGGVARWLASLLVLSCFYALCVVMLAAVIGVRDPAATIRHGIAASSAGVSMGLGVVGTAGLKQGFSGPFAAVMTMVTVLASLGLAGMGWVPVGSMFAWSASGWSALASAVVLGIAACAIYAKRTGRA